MKSKKVFTTLKKLLCSGVESLSNFVKGQLKLISVLMQSACSCSKADVERTDGRHIQGDQSCSS